MIARMACAVALLAVVWWLAQSVPAWLVYRSQQRMVEDKAKQLGEVRRHEDEFSRWLEGVKPWK